jgi:RimJ/RimL family protein N-acetyltransferase
MLRPTYPIETDRLLLRPLGQEDLESMLAIQSRPDVARYLYWEPRSRDEVADFIATSSSTLEDEGDKLRLAVVERATGGVIGEVVLIWESRRHMQGEIGFTFHPDHHGKGFATEAARALLKLGFERLDLHRIIGRCDDRNGASAAVMERLGMRREAHFLANEWIKEEWQGELVYAMLREEWDARSE